MKRVLCLLIDQLTGHWEESVTIRGTDLPPVNLDGYHRLGLIPHFSHLIENGLWVKKPWNRGGCATQYGMRYLATGSYKSDIYFENDGWRPCCYEKELTSFTEAISRNCKDSGRSFVSGVFGSLRWTDDFLSDSCYIQYPPDGCNDETMLTEHAIPWLGKTRDWNLAIVYFPQMDAIGDAGWEGEENAWVFNPALAPPDFVEPRENRIRSKHDYLMVLDALAGELITFLKREDFWEETYIIVTSDHGAHLGCSVAAELGAKTDNLWIGHPSPYDCEVWDFEDDKSAGIYSGGPRRVSFIVSGGGLDEQLKGTFVEEAEIIDVAPTIADIFGVTFECEGKSILKNPGIKSQKP